MARNGDVFDIEVLQALPGLVMMLGGDVRSLLQKALEEELIEKVRDLLIEIKDRLNVMTEAAHAAVINEEDGDNAHRPKGEKRPADVIGNAVKVMRIATGKVR